MCYANRSDTHCSQQKEQKKKKTLKENWGESVKFFTPASPASLYNTVNSAMFVLTDENRNNSCELSAAVKMLPALSHPPYNELWMLCSALTDCTASPLRERSKRAHKWTNASAVTPSTTNHWLTPNPQALLGIVVFCDFAFRQWAEMISLVKMSLLSVYSYNEAEIVPEDP